MAWFRVREINFVPDYPSTPGCVLAISQLKGVSLKNQINQYLYHQLPRSLQTAQFQAEKTRPRRRTSLAAVETSRVKVYLETQYIAARRYVFQGLYYGNASNEHHCSAVKPVQRTCQCKTRGKRQKSKKVPRGGQFSVF